MIARSWDAETGLSKSMGLLAVNISTSVLMSLLLTLGSGSEPLSPTNHRAVSLAQPYMFFVVFLVHMYISSLVARDILLAGLNNLLVCYPYLALTGFESPTSLSGLAGTVFGMFGAAKAIQAGGAGVASILIRKRPGREISLNTLLAYLVGYSFTYSTMLIALIIIGVFNYLIIPLLRAYPPILFVATIIAGYFPLYLRQDPELALLSGMLAGAGPMGLVPSIIIALSPKLSRASS